MSNLIFRSPQRPTRQESNEPRPQRPLPRVFVSKLECDLKQQDKIVRAMFGRRPG